MLWAGYTAPCTTAAAAGTRSWEGQGILCHFLQLDLQGRLQSGKNLEKKLHDLNVALPADYLRREGDASPFSP